MKHNSKYKNILTKEFLIKEYTKSKKSMNQIGKMFNIDPTTVYYNLKINNIRTRNLKEAYRLRVNKLAKLNWKGNKAVNRKIYYCKEKPCDNIIEYHTALYGSELCKSCEMKKRWQYSEYREKTLKASFEGKEISPNKPEKLLIKLLNKILPKEYCFVGDGRLTVGGFCPDFVNKDNNKIIELFGCYWHKCQECGFGNGRPVDQRRLKTYKEYGYETLIIWEHELNDLDKTTKKLLNFFAK